MVLMLDTKGLNRCESDLGEHCEQLFTPLTRRDPARPKHRFAMDNGAFSKFDSRQFWRMLEKHAPRKKLCRWVAVPDVVGSARRTSEIFHLYKERIKDWPLAYVAQDGQENIPIPWEEIDALFVGGSNEFKLGPFAVHCIKAAQILGKWVHVGRVNTFNRLEHFKNLGVDSVDGTGLVKFEGMRHSILSQKKQQRLKL